MAIKTSTWRRISAGVAVLLYFFSTSSAKLVKKRLFSVPILEIELKSFSVVST